MATTPFAEVIASSLMTRPRNGFAGSPDCDRARWAPVHVKKTEVLRPTVPCRSRCSIRMAGSLAVVIAATATGSTCDELPTDHIFFVMLFPKGLAFGERGHSGASSPDGRIGCVPAVHAVHKMLVRNESALSLTSFAGRNVQPSERAHMVPWADCSDEQRLDVYNGLLLSALWSVLWRNAGQITQHDKR
jgi:hypothetical protein